MAIDFKDFGDKPSDPREARIADLERALRLCVNWMECGAQTRLSDLGERDRAERIRLATAVLNAGKGGR